MEVCFCHYTYREKSAVDTSGVFHAFCPRFIFHVKLQARNHNITDDLELKFRPSKEANLDVREIKRRVRFHCGFLNLCWTSDGQPFNENWNSKGFPFVKPLITRHSNIFLNKNPFELKFLFNGCPSLYWTHIRSRFYPFNRLIDWFI